MSSQVSVQILNQSKYFRLTKCRHRKSEKVHYRITLIDHPWEAYDVSPQSFFDQVRDIVDPLRNKSGAAGIHWKFRSQDQAEKLYMTLLLKFS